MWGGGTKGKEGVGLVVGMVMFCTVLGERTKKTGVVQEIRTRNQGVTDGGGKKNCYNRSNEGRMFNHNE